MLNPLRFCLAVLVVGGFLGPQPAQASTDAPPVECWIENFTPEVQLGAQANYVVHLSGGLGSYSVNFGFGDGTFDAQSVSAPQASFAHWFSATGVYSQSAYVSGAGSSTSCGSSTSVY